MPTLTEWQDVLRGVFARKIPAFIGKVKAHHVCVGVVMSSTELSHAKVCFEYVVRLRARVEEFSEKLQV